MNYRLLYILVVAMWGCAGGFSSMDALATLQGLEEFRGSFSAPLTLGSEVVGSDVAEDPEGFSQERFGALLSEGLVSAEIVKTNSWRTVLVMSLTDKGKEYYDKARTEHHLREGGSEDVVFVNVCNLRVESIKDIREISKDRVEVDYVITEHDITPFGDFLGYEEGKEHNHTRVFEKGTFSWGLCEK